jgi:stage III sporulation protein AB
MKLLGGSLILAAGWLAGRKMADGAEARLAELAELRVALSALKSNVEFGRKDLPDALMAAAAAGGGEASTIFASAARGIRDRNGTAEEIWRGSVAGSNLQGGDKTALSAFAGALGRPDAGFLAEAIDSAIAYVAGEEERAVPVARRDAKMYRSVGVLLGALVCVLLI